MRTFFSAVSTLFHVRKQAGDLRNRFSEWLLVLKVILLLASMRAALAVMPFSRLQRFVSRPQARPRRAGLTRQRKVLALLERVGHRMLRPRPCLPQALAGKWLHQRWGMEAELRIGVVKTSEGTLQAHAWLERDGRIILGRIPSIDDYKVLIPLSEKSEEKSIGAVGTELRHAGTAPEMNGRDGRAGGRAEEA